MPANFERPSAELLLPVFIAAVICAAPALASVQQEFFSLSGIESADFVLPPDMILEHTSQPQGTGVTVERYRQIYDGARVLGGQITIHRDEQGNVIRVDGAHFSDIAPSNVVNINASGARGLVDRDVGRDRMRDTTLMFDPVSGQFFWQLKSHRAGNIWVHQIGAASGRILKKYDALTNENDCN
jgi:Zn-dependent metalloprotease